MTLPKQHIADISKDLLERYKRHELTSIALGEITGFHPAALRRAIKRPRKERARPKSELILLRQAYQASIAHLQPREIVKLACVSLSTANRIRKKYKDGT